NRWCRRDPRDPDPSPGRSCAFVRGGLRSLGPVRSRRSRPFPNHGDHQSMSIFSSRRPQGVIAALGTLVGVALIVGAQAPALKPKPEDEIKDKLTARIVVALLENNHLAKPTINEDISKKWCRNFLKKLDPMKHYFLKADVEEFLAQEATLGARVKKGDIAF